jgi:D-alanine-D-alanine ligase
MKIAILYNLPTVTKDTSFSLAEADTEASARLVADALTKQGMDTVLHPVTVETIPTIMDIRADCIFNLIEWTGEDIPYVAQAFLFLDRLGTPYTGASFENYYITVDKLPMKQSFRYLSIPTPAWSYLTDPAGAIDPSLRFPLIVKIATEHSGIGLTDRSVVYTKTALRTQVQSLFTDFHQPVLVEEYIEGTEYQMTALMENGILRMLPAATYTFDTHKPIQFLTFTSRWEATNDKNTQFSASILPIDPVVEKKMSKICAHTFDGMRFFDYARFDIRVRDGQPYILEANSNPGLDDAPDNGLAVAFHAAGMSFGEFLQTIIRSALRRTASHPRVR